MENFNAEEYEKKLRIEYKVKKEFSDKNDEEWVTAGCGVIFFFILILLIAALSEY